MKPASYPNICKISKLREWLVWVEMAVEPENERVCVTEAGGFVAFWLVKLLLTKDYIVHGTVKKRGDSKNASLYMLDKASENPKLFEADLLDYHFFLFSNCGLPCSLSCCKSLSSSTVTDPEVQMVEPAVKEKLKVPSACVETKVNRVVFVSSVAAITVNPSWPKSQVKDETVGLIKNISNE